MERVRQIDIARKAEVSRSTVSLALIRHPRIPKETQDRIFALAEEMGYERDPALSVLSDYRRKVTRKDYRGTLALVSTVPVLEPKRDDSGAAKNKFYLGGFAPLQAEARSLGYAVEFFNLGSTRREQERMSTVMHRRGIKGLLVAARPEPIEDLAVNWNLFSAVQVSGAVRRGPLNRVQPDHFDEVMQTLSELERRGYERQVLVIFGNPLDPVLERYLGAYAQGIRHFANAFPAQFFRTGEEAAEWCQKHQPDVVIGKQSHFLLKCLQESGVQIPEQVGYCDLHIATPTHAGAIGVSGFRQSGDEVAIQAVRLLDSMLTQNECGLPKHPLTLEVGGEWVEGATLRARRRLVDSTEHHI